MNLKQKLIDEILDEMAAKLRQIEANVGLIAEAEALSERLRAHLLEDGYTSNPVITVHKNKITARVQFNYLPRHKITAAIARAGLRIAGESEPSWDRNSTLLHLEGFDVPIHDTTSIHFVVPAEAAEELSA